MQGIPGFWHPLQGLDEEHLALSRWQETQAVKVPVSREDGVVGVVGVVRRGVPGDNGASSPGNCTLGEDVGEEVRLRRIEVMTANECLLA